MQPRRVVLLDDEAGRLAGAARRLRRGGRLARRGEVALGAVAPSWSAVCTRARGMAPRYPVATDIRPGAVKIARGGSSAASMERAMRRHLASVLVLVSLLAVLAPAAAQAKPRPAACSSAHIAVHRATVARARNATLCLLNRARARAGLPPLRANARLARAARRHASDMVRRRYFAHDSLGGVTAFERILRAHYVPRRRSWWLGENIGWGSLSLSQPAALVRAWMHSPPHRANILSRRFREVGIGISPGVPVRGHRLAGATYTTDFGRHS